jgi:myo-inositol-1(or 4)-monophosphatase
MIAAARRAAAALREDAVGALRGGLEVTEKAASDFVTSADLRSQRLVRDALFAAHPDHGFLLEEETGGSGEGAGDGAARFIVDPLDGTTNFLRGIPQFAVTIAREQGGVVVSGLVLDVARDRLFWAERGGGAWLDDERLAVSRERELGRMVVGTGIPHRGRGDHVAYLAALAQVMRDVGGIRRFGSAALDLAYVAAGRFDAFFERGLSAWDVAAGALLVREAGGVVTQTDGSKAHLEGDVLAASSPEVHAAMLARIRPLHGGASFGG